MTKPRGITKAGTPVHHVRNDSPRFVTLTDDKERRTVLCVSLEPMYIRKQGLTQESIENVKRVYCDELDRAYKLYRTPPEKRDR